MDRVTFGADEYLNSNAGRLVPLTRRRSSSAPRYVAQKKHSWALGEDPAKGF